MRLNPHEVRLKQTSEMKGGVGIWSQVRGFRGSWDQVRGVGVRARLGVQRGVRPGWGIQEELESG